MTNATREACERVYRDTHFHVYAPTPFVLRVGEFSAPLAKLHAEHQVTLLSVPDGVEPSQRDAFGRGE